MTGNSCTGAEGTRESSSFLSFARRRDLWPLLDQPEFIGRQLEQSAEEPDVPRAGMPDAALPSADHVRIHTDVVLIAGQSVKTVSDLVQRPAPEPPLVA